MNFIPPPIDTSSESEKQFGNENVHTFLGSRTSSSDQQGAQQTATTLFSNCPITPSEAYTKVVDPERRKLLAILALFVFISPLIFRYVCGSSASADVDSRDIKWASDIDSWEWSVLIVLWLGILGSIMRLLPMVSGRPASVEASQQCNLDGVAALGLCSPFSSEDDAILLRSLLGRTCTVFHTVGSRHAYQGLYMDTILNERRIKGEAYRRNIWVSWMKFMNALVDVCLLIKEQNAAQGQEEGFEMTSPGRDGNSGKEHDLFSASTDSVALAPYRALYVQGVMGSRGVACATPRIARQSSVDSTASITTPRQVTFKDMGAVFDSTRGISEAQRQRVQSWGRDQTSGPLSMGMVAASPRGAMSPHTRVPTGMQPSQRSYPKRSRLKAFSSDDQQDHDGPDKPINRHLSQIVENATEDEFDEEDLENPGVQALRSMAALSTHHLPPQSTPNRDVASMMGMRQLSDISDPHNTSFRTNSVEERVATFSGEIELSPYNRDQEGLDLGFPAMDGDSSRSHIGTPSRRNRAQHSLTDASPAQNSPGRASSPRAATAAGAVGGAAQSIFNTIAGLTIDIMSSAPTPRRLRAAPTPTPASFAIAPTPRARQVTPRQADAAASYARPHGVSNLELDMADLVPMISFLDGWLKEMQDNEWTYDYYNPKSAIEKLFFASPFMAHFKGEHMLAVHSALDNLYDAFTNPVKDEPDPKRPYHPDEVSEVEWVLRRENLPDWTVIWSFASRARLREMKRSDYCDPHGPDAFFQSTRIKPGAIVYRKPTANVTPEYAPLAYFTTRAARFKVDIIKTASNGKAVAHLLPFPADPRAQKSDPESGAQHDDIHTIIPVEELSLLEMNRGKTGALNFFNDYLRAKTVKWSDSLGMRHAVQTFVGIVDARHALVETDVFWNDALPYFSKVETTGMPGKRFGSLTEHSICITVQYPQFFSNVGDDDVLDNSNSTYYNLWQTLRDGAKCICSSGTNAIWDISNPKFEFCTKSRSEDLGTSHEYIPHCAAVYLCVNVALGIAKKTEDFLEALYRWSAGPLELLWPSFLIPKILKHFIRVAIPTGLFAMASFHPSPYWFFAYLAMVGLLLLKAFADKRAGRKPLRDLNVSTVVTINLFIVCSNLMSVMWFVIFPVRIAFYGLLPLGRSDTQGLFWGWISLFISLPTGIIHDSLIRIARHTAPATKEMNYHKCLWRGGQLYANSFMFTLLATIAGTYSAYKAYMYDYDLSMWSSFRVADSEFDKLTAAMRKTPFFSSAFAQLLWQYASLYVNSMLAALTMPTTMTKWYVTGTFLLQFVCMFVSTFIVNREEVLKLCVVLFMCSLNVLMTMEVALLLQPIFKYPIGFPFRAEYLFGMMGFIIVVSALVNGALDLQTIVVRVRLNP